MTTKNKNPYYVSLSNSTNSNKKLMAVFYNKEKQKLKTIHFGQAGANDYTTHPKNIRDERKKLYIERHKDKENWKNPMAGAGVLSRYILWNKPSRIASFNDFLSRFNLKRL